MENPIIWLAVFAGILCVRMLWVSFRGFAHPVDTGDAELICGRLANLSAKEVLRFSENVIRENLGHGAFDEELGQEALQDIDASVRSSVYFLENLFKVGSLLRRFPRALIEHVIASAHDTQWAGIGFVGLVHDTGFVEYDSEEDEYMFSSDFIGEVLSRAEADAKSKMAMLLVESTL